MMTRTIHGKVHGRTIELDEDLGVPEGQDVEIQLKIIGPRKRLPGPPPGWQAGSQRTTAGMLVDTWTEEDDLTFRTSAVEFPRISVGANSVGAGVWKLRRRLRADSAGKAHGNPVPERSISSAAATRARDKAGTQGEPWTARATNQHGLGYRSTRCLHSQGRDATRDAASAIHVLDWDCSSACRLSRSNTGVPPKQS
jgi:hypothetical protein